MFNISKIKLDVVKISLYGIHMYKYSFNFTVTALLTGKDWAISVGSVEKLGKSDQICA